MIIACRGSISSMDLDFDFMADSGENGRLCEALDQAGIWNLSLDQMAEFILEEKA